MGNSFHSIIDSNVQMIPIETPVGKFKVYTKRVGNNATMKVLLLHGGPASTHELFESFEKFLPDAGIEFYYYDQLGSHSSERPKDTSLWTIERFVDEVEQVRIALELNKDNFYLYGHSWGGILAIEYALIYQQNLKGLIISDMMSSAPDYSKYVNDVLLTAIDPETVKELKGMEAKNMYEDLKYQKLLLDNFQCKYYCRLEPWPGAVTRAFTHINKDVYHVLQGPSAFKLLGLLEKWNRKEDLLKIQVPTLMIGATYDTMDPEHMKWMATQVQQGSVLICPNGSHSPMWDDKEHYFPGLIQFIKTVDQGEKPAPVIQI